MSGTVEKLFPLGQLYTILRLLHYHPSPSEKLGTSLVVQQLRLCLPLQAVCLPSLVRELRIPWYLWTKNQTIKQKQYGKKFHEDLEKKKKY